MWKEIIGGGLSLLGLNQGQKEQKKANQMQERALQQSEREYTERAPMRRLGMQALGQIERPMDLGNLGFNPSNPYAAARGPSPSTSTYGGWGEMTYALPPEPPPQTPQQNIQALGAHLSQSKNKHIRNLAPKVQARAGSLPAGPAPQAVRYGWDR